MDHHISAHKRNNQGDTRNQIGKSKYLESRTILQKWKLTIEHLRNKIGKFSGKLLRSYLYLSIGSKLVLLTLNDTLHQ